MRVKAGVAIVLLLCGTALAQQNNACAAEIRSVRAVPERVVAYSSAEVTNRSAKLSFKCRNNSQKKIESVSLRVKGKVQVSGPSGPALLDTAREFRVKAEVLPGKQKRLSTDPLIVPIPLQMEVVEVTFVDGSHWVNTVGFSCVK